MRAGDRQTDGRRRARSRGDYRDKNKKNTKFNTRLHGWIWMTDGRRIVLCAGTEGIAGGKTENIARRRRRLRRRCCGKDHFLAMDCSLIRAKIIR